MKITSIFHKHLIPSSCLPLLAFKCYSCCFASNQAGPEEVKPAPGDGVCVRVLMVRDGHLSYNNAIHIQEDQYSLPLFYILSFSPTFAFIFHLATESYHKFLSSSAAPSFICLCNVRDTEKTVILMLLCVYKTLSSPGGINV